MCQTRYTLFYRLLLASLRCAARLSVLADSLWLTALLQRFLPLLLSRSERQLLTFHLGYLVVEAPENLFA
jgi:hypothetical protein